MTFHRPEERPTAEEALYEWKTIREAISIVNKEWRPREREEDHLSMAILDALSLYRLMVSFSRSGASFVGINIQ